MEVNCPECQKVFEIPKERLQKYDKQIKFEKDQSIVTKVLRLGNSAYYGVSGKIATVQHAAVLLGQKTLGEIITMAGISIWATACQGLTPKFSLDNLMGKALLISLLSLLL